MGRAIDTLESKMENLASDPSKIADESFMMGLFDEYIEELPPLKEYWELLFEKKQMAVIARKSGTKVVHLARLRRQLFRPTKKTERESTNRMVELAKIAADAILQELRDEKKRRTNICRVSRRVTPTSTRRRSGKGHSSARRQQTMRPRAR